MMRREWCTWLPLAALAAAALVAPPRASAANILCILTTPTKSHHIWNSVWVAALADRGHNVTVLSPMAFNPPRANVTDLVLDDSLAFQDSLSNYQEMTQLTPMQWIGAVLDWYVASCNYSIHTNGARQLFDYPDNFRFDLIVIEASGGECLLGFVEKFGRPPVVAVNAFGNPQWLNWNAGNPDNPAHVTNFHLTVQWPFSFAQKLRNVAMYLSMLYQYYVNYLPANDQILRRHFGGSAYGARLRGAAESLRDVTLVLVNAHYALDGARPNVPGVVPVGGLQVRPPQPLPQDLQEFLDGATQGCVYMSLGTLVRSDQLGPRQIQALVAAFNELPRGIRVLWKWESDAPPGELPPNVRTGKWMPQSDILAHPNVRVFLSHAGMLSTHEATWRGVPVVAMPFVVDQYLNAHRLVALGVAEELDYRALSKDAVLAALSKVLGDPSYRQRMRQLSAIFRTRPRPPLDEAIFWMEHVLRHGGAPRMRSPAADMPWFSLWLLDVAAVAALAAAAPLAICVCCARVARRTVFAKRKTE